jgi:ribosomal protein S18 acetylase RimI-like enzyme
MTFSDTLKILNTITIRKATLADVSKLAAIGRMTFVETFADTNTKEDMTNYVQKAFNREQVKSELLDEKNVFLLAYDRNTLAGYAKLRSGHEPDELCEEKPIEIQRIYVRQSFIEKKIGKHVMEECLKIAKKGKYETIWLGVWEYNPRAIRFYENWGFKKFSKHTFLLGFDEQTDILMKKKV